MRAAYVSFGRVGSSMTMNKPDDASTSRIVEIILRSIHLSDETPVDENMLFVEMCCKGRLRPLSRRTSSRPCLVFRKENYSLRTGESNAPVQSIQCGSEL